MQGHSVLVSDDDRRSTAVRPQVATQDAEIVHCGCGWELRRRRRGGHSYTASSGNAACTLTWWICSVDGNVCRMKSLYIFTCTSYCNYELLYYVVYDKWEWDTRLLILPRGIGVSRCTPWCTPKRPPTPQTIVCHSGPSLTYRPKGHSTPPQQTNYVLETPVAKQ